SRPSSPVLSSRVVRDQRAEPDRCRRAYESAPPRPERSGLVSDGAGGGRRQSAPVAPPTVRLAPSTCPGTGGMLGEWILQSSEDTARSGGSQSRWRPPLPTPLPR